MGKKIEKLSVFIFLLTLVLLITIEINTSADVKKDVLFISSYNPNFINFNDQVEGIREGLGEEFQIQIEYMDFNIFSSEENEKVFYNLLKHKINNYHSFDAVILSGNEALKFGIKFRNDLFLNIPIVFMGVEEDHLAQEALELGGISGVMQRNSLLENIDLAIKLQPQVENIYLIHDKGDSWIVNIYEEAKNKYTNVNIDRIFVEDMYFSEFEEFLNSLDKKKDAIVMGYPNSDKTGKYIDPWDGIRLVIKNTEVAVYPIVNYGIGEGLLGGKVVSHHEQGKKASEIVLSILNGENPKELLVIDDSANKYIFDYEKLKDFNIDINKLSSNSIILNKPMPFLERYKNIILPFALVFISLISIIIVLIIHSINRSKYEKKLLEAKKVAEEANRAKGNFISNINHELRTPVSVIMSAIQLLNLKLDKVEDRRVDDVKKNLNVINQNCFRLLRLINNIIDTTKVDSGFYELDLKNINIIELLESIVLSVVPYAVSKNIEIIFDTSEEVVLMAVDPDKIERIVLNLLSNAIKFSKDHGIIEVNVDISGENLEFSIKDNGIGIDEEHINKIFDRFTQVDNSFMRKNEGSGIGLSLVKSFIKMHNGKIVVESKLGEGSKFCVQIPIIIVENIGSDISEDIQENSTILSTKVEFSDIYF